MDYGPELTTVADDSAVVHVSGEVREYHGLRPGTAYEIEGFSFRTFPRLGEALCVFATVNDVHFGEVEAGRVGGADTGPVFASEPGQAPYPEMMNHAAIEEIRRLDPAAVVVKGDLTSDGTDEQCRAFLDAYGAFAERLVYVRGNHESYNESPFAAWATQRIDLPGVTIALLDTSRPRATTGWVSDEQLEWLDDLAASADRPVLAMGHHHPWAPESVKRPATYFGINPDDSERLVEVVARRPAILGYFAGHTHRNRVRRFAATGEVPWVEVACVKDYPGTWAEYRVFEGGILQVHRRISTPEALAWTEKTRYMFGGSYGWYALGGLEDRCLVMRSRPGGPS